MKPLKAKDIYGNWATLLLPIDESGAVDYVRLKEELDILTSERLNGIYSNQAVDKLLAAIGGWTDISSRLRWPYRWIPESTATELRPVARDMLPELFGQAVSYTL